MLAVYTGTNLDALTVETGDEDRGGFLTSEASFNAAAGTHYAIAIDGFAGASGHIVLSWSLDTNAMPFPHIISEPLSQTHFRGDTVTFAVVVDNPAVTYRWYFGCDSISGATNAQYTIANVHPENVGGYHVVVQNASSYVAESL